MTLLYSQFSYIFATMDDAQKSRIDYCTQNYVERIMQIKPFFSESCEQLIRDAEAVRIQLDNKRLLQYAADYGRRILKGEYLSINGDERLQVESNKFIKINYAYSGQQ